MFGVGPHHLFISTGIYRVQKKEPPKHFAVTSEHLPRIEHG